ncbi:MAG: hypothetical protein V1859_01005 [archaeon]
MARETMFQYLGLPRYSHETTHPLESLLALAAHDQQPGHKKIASAAKTSLQTRIRELDENGFESTEYFSAAKSYMDTVSDNYGTADIKAAMARICQEPIIGIAKAIGNYHRECLDLKDSAEKQIQSTWNPAIYFLTQYSSILSEIKANAINKMTAEAREDAYQVLGEKIRLRLREMDAKIRLYWTNKQV